MVAVWSILRADLYPQLISENALTDIPKIWLINSLGVSLERNLIFEKFINIYNESWLYMPTQSLSSTLLSYLPFQLQVLFYKITYWDGLVLTMAARLSSGSWTTCQWPTSKKSDSPSYNSPQLTDSSSSIRSGVSGSLPPPTLKSFIL